MWIIYKHTLLAEGEHQGWSYIGMTHYDDNLNLRFHGGSSYSYNALFYEDIKKYGWHDGFAHEILQDNIATQKEAFDAEIYWILYFHTWIKDPEYKGGYNRSPGGAGANHKLTIINGNDFSTVKVILSHDIDKYEETGWRTLTTTEYRYWQRYILNKKEIENAKSRERYKKDGKERYQKNRANRLKSNKKYVEKKKVEDLELYKQKHRESNKWYWEKNKDEINRKKREKRKNSLQ